MAAHAARLGPAASKCRSFQRSTSVTGSKRNDRRQSPLSSSARRSSKPSQRSDTPSQLDRFIRRSPRLRSSSGSQPLRRRSGCGSRSVTSSSSLGSEIRRGLFERRRSERAGFLVMRGSSPNSPRLSLMIFGGSVETQGRPSVASASLASSRFKRSRSKVKIASPGKWLGGASVNSSCSAPLSSRDA